MALETDNVICSFVVHYQLLLYQQKPYFEVPIEQAKAVLENFTRSVTKKRDVSVTELKCRVAEGNWEALTTSRELGRGAAQKITLQHAQCLIDLFVQGATIQNGNATLHPSRVTHAERSTHPVTYGPFE